MPYLKNIAFTALIKINGRLREFNFRRRHELLYDGDTNDERGERYFFNAQKVNDQWTLTGSVLPSWIILHQIPITEAIVKQEQEISVPRGIATKK